MSATENKRDLASALADAEDFRALFPPASYERWTIAGSIRRKKASVGDCEHVVMPAFADVADPGDMFATPKRTNLLWARLDELVAAGTVTKHLYGETRTTRWGEKYRGCDFRGFNHELFTADDENHGAILAIRTGPADYSEQLVTRLKAGNMYRQSGGYVVHVRSGERVAVPTEESFFKLCCVPFTDPEKRL